VASTRVARASQAAYVAAVSGAIALVLIALFFTIGEPFGTLNDIALLVMTLAIAPVMLGSYELGGLTPLWPARLSLAGGIAAVLVWSAIQAVMIARLVTFDYYAPATGAFLVENIALLVIGAWLTGAPLLAGPWLPSRLRWLGALAGLGFVLTAAGLIAGGVNNPLTYTGGIGYQILFPVWAFLVARVFSSRASTPRPAG
jgi:hypothetical protein